MSNKALSLVGTALSISALALAFGIELISHIPACPLCWTQRGIHALILLGGLWSLWKGFSPLRVFLSLYGLGAALAFYQVGLEHAWWEPSFLCPSQFPQDTLTPEQLHHILSTPFKNSASCSQVFLRLGGLSLAEWSALFMGVGTCVLIKLAVKKKTP